MLKWDHARLLSSYPNQKLEQWAPTVADYRMEQTPTASFLWYFIEDWKNWHSVHPQREEVQAICSTDMDCFVCLVIEVTLFILFSLSVEFLYCDLASMKSIHQFVQKFKEKNYPLHVLINNGKLFFFSTMLADWFLHIWYCFLLGTYAKYVIWHYFIFCFFLWNTEYIFVFFTLISLLTCSRVMSAVALLNLHFWGGG